MRQLVLDLLAPRVPGFDNFLAGANAEALASVRALAEGRLAESVVYLWGEAGCGRSHLLNAASASVLDAAASSKLVVADDVERLDDAAQVALFNRINEAREGGPSVLAAGNAPPSQLALREDLRSRLGWGLVYQLQPLTDADKADYLHAESARRGLALGDGVIGYLLTRARRDMAFLEALVAHLDRHALEHQRRVTIPLVRDALGSLDHDPPRPV